MLSLLGTVVLLYEVTLSAALEFETLSGWGVWVSMRKRTRCGNSVLAVLVPCRPALDSVGSCAWDERWRVSIPSLRADAGRAIYITWIPYQVCADRGPFVARMLCGAQFDTHAIYPGWMLQFGIPLLYTPLLVRTWRIVCLYSTTLDWRLRPVSPLTRIRRDEYGNLSGETIPVMIIRGTLGVLIFARLV
jgi:hypothetical protein